MIDFCTESKNGAIYINSFYIAKITKLKKNLRVRELS